MSIKFLLLVYELELSLTDHLVLCSYINLSLLVDSQLGHPLLGDVGGHSQTLIVVSSAVIVRLHHSLDLLQPRFVAPVKARNILELSNINHHDHTPGSYQVYSRSHRSPSLPRVMVSAPQPHSSSPSLHHHHQQSPDHGSPPAGQDP